MTSLDPSDLEGICELARRRIARRERRIRMRPIQEAFFAQSRLVTRTIVPDIMAPFQANSRKSLASLEETLRIFPEKLQAAEADMNQVLSAARARTDLLKQWLEALQ